MKTQFRRTSETFCVFTQIDKLKGDEEHQWLFRSNISCPPLIIRKPRGDLANELIFISMRVFRLTTRGVTNHFKVVYKLRIIKSKQKTFRF